VTRPAGLNFSGGFRAFELIAGRLPALRQIARRRNYDEGGQIRIKQSRIESLWKIKFNR
jgi:hypothetical protein